MKPPDTANESIWMKQWLILFGIEIFFGNSATLLMGVNVIFTHNFLKV